MVREVDSSEPDQSRYFLQPPQGGTQPALLSTHRGHASRHTQRVRSRLRNVQEGAVPARLLAGRFLGRRPRCERMGREHAVPETEQLSWESPSPEQNTVWKAVLLEISGEFSLLDTQQAECQRNSIWPT